MFAMGAVWYFWTITTYGVNVPSGLFLPGMIVGCSLGDLYTALIADNGLCSPEHAADHRVTYVILGMGAMLAGYTRMTYSLVVVTMETTMNVNMFIPIVIAVGMSNYVGGLFNRSLYERAVRAKQMPIIINHVPHCNRLLRAEKIMCREVHSLQVVDTVENIQKACQTRHSAFPVLNKTGRVVGLISKNFLIVLIANKAFYQNKKGIQNQEKAFSSKGSVAQYDSVNYVNPSSDESGGAKKLLGDTALKSNYHYEDPVDTLDYDCFPVDDTKVILSWRYFRSDFKGLDKQLDSETNPICEKHPEQLVDLREYMIEHPEQCTQLDFLPKIVARFRHLHLRHLIVTNPFSGHAHGIITRGDIFNWMPL